MTKEEFFKLAQYSRQPVTQDCIYNLTIRRIFKCLDDYGDVYLKEKLSLYYPPLFYSTKEEAIEAMNNYIENQDDDLIIHSILIKRIPINVPVKECVDYIDWWMYDWDGIEIDHSVCCQCCPSEPVKAVYFGRKPDEIRFKVGEVVEILNPYGIDLGIIIRRPSSIDDMWNKYNEEIKKNGEIEDGTYPINYFDTFF